MYVNQLTLLKHTPFNLQKSRPSCSSAVGTLTRSFCVSCLLKMHRGFDIMEQQRQDEGDPKEYGNRGHVEEEHDGQTAYLAAQHQNPVGGGLRYRMGLFHRIGQPDRHGRDEEETEDKTAQA